MMKSLRILLLDTKSSNPNHYLCLAVEEALSQHPQVEAVFCCDYSNAIAIAVERRANFFLAFDGEDPDLNICARLATVCGQSAVWFTEDPYEIETNIINSKIFDIVFTNDSAEQVLSGYGEKAHHLPLAASEFFHFHKVVQDEGAADAGFLYDLLFVGTAWPNRVSFLATLLPMLPDLKYKIALPTNSHLPKFKLPIPKFEYSWKTSNVEFAKMANRSRIVLSLHRDYANSGENTMASTPGPRLFEVALAGGFQLVSSELKEVSEYYKPEDIISFDGPEDCAAKIRYYLKNTAERIQSAGRAQEVTRKHHLYRHRVEELVKVINRFSENSKIIQRAEDSASDIASVANSPEALKSRCLEEFNVPKKNLLFVTHNTIKSEVYGGVEVYQDRLAKAVADEFNVYYLAPTLVDSKYFSPGVLLMDSSYKTVLKMNFCPENNLNNFRSEQRELFFKRILVEYKIDLVHFQHLVGHCLSLPLISKQLGVPSVMSIHDYYFACENFNLINHQRIYCRADRHDLSVCDVCLHETKGKVPGVQAARRTFCDQVLAAVDLLLFNTQGVQDIFLSFFREKALLQKCRVRPLSSENRPNLHAWVSSSAPPAATRRDFSSARPLKVASIGSFLSSKGSETQLAVFELCRDLPIEFCILGNISEDEIARIKGRELKNVHIKGHYSPGELGGALAEVDMSIHLSIWPETYCLTLSEAWQFGLIPIVTDIGALGERVQNGVNGFKVQVNDSEAVFQILKKILNSSESLQEMRKNVTSELWVTNHEAELLDDYGKIFDSSEPLNEQNQDKNLLPGRNQDSIFPVTKVGPVAAVLFEVNSVLPKFDPIRMINAKIVNSGRLLLRLFFHLKHNGIKKTAARIVKRLKHV